jgi:hypothetical protein
LAGFLRGSHKSFAFGDLRFPTEKSEALLLVLVEPAMVTGPKQGDPTMKDKIRVVSRWAARVVEFGPASARRRAAEILDEANRMLLFRDSDSSDLLDELAEECLEFCLENFIQAPPGIHARLLRVEDYRSRLRRMRCL